jgi:tRNA G18 (ribose-2'-O)-methylase SpoU
VVGAAAVAAALAAGEPLRFVVVPRQGASEEALALVARAAAQGVEILRVGDRKFERLRGNHSATGILGLIGPAPAADLSEVMSRGGAVWLLTGPAYPGNVGFAIRTAEVSGADGVYIDNDFDHRGRRESRRASMRADTFMPTGWKTADEVLTAARAAGKHVVGIEDVGAVAPWEAGLSGSVLLVVGSEAEGVPREVLDRCDEVVRIPMGGFIASYNLQTAVAAIAAERFRQLERDIR